MPGLLALVGGDEFKPGNEEQDRLMVAAAGAGPAYVLPTAAARQGPDRAVAHATEWFASLGLPLRELPVLRRSDAMRASLADEAARGGFFYLVGGDPGLGAPARCWRARPQAPWRFAATRSCARHGRTVSTGARWRRWARFRTPRCCRTTTPSGTNGSTPRAKRRPT